MSDEWKEAPPPEEQPQVERPRIERSFKQMVDLTDLDLPDWEFITRVVELLEPYKEADNEDSFTIHGGDSRGSYYVYDLEAFREEYDERGEQLRSTTIKTYGHDSHGFFMFTVHYSREYGRGQAEIAGGNEIVVNGLAARIDQLAKEASERRKARQKARKAEASAAAPTPAPEATPRNLWNHPWVVGIGTAVIAALIVALILWAISSH